MVWPWPTKTSNRVEWGAAGGGLWPFATQGLRLTSSKKCRCSSSTKFAWQQEGGQPENMEREEVWIERGRVMDGDGAASFLLHTLSERNRKDG